MEPLWFRFRLNEHGQEIGEDMSFCMDAKDAGYAIWVDCSLRVGHLGQKAFYREDWQQQPKSTFHTCSGAGCAFSEMGMCTGQK